MSDVAHAALLAIIDSLTVGVLTLDEEQRVCHCNRWLARHAGIQQQDAEGKPINALFPEITGTRLAQAIDHAVRDRLPSLLSPALHGTLLPLHQSERDRTYNRRLQQLIHVMPLPLGTGRAVCMIQISDMTANISRERLLRQQTETLRRTNNQDPLTGLANRRKFDETLSSEFNRAQQGGYPLGLMVIDIDDFSAFNAHYGREHGDAILSELGALMRDLARPVDLAARYGGEEFGLILPGLDEAQACHLAENIRLRINTLAVANAASSISKHLTVSIGLTVMTPDSEADTHTLLSSADVALYQAKHEGRNQAVYFSIVDGSFKLCG